MTIQTLLDRYEGRPIRGCPGRYVLAGAHPRLTVEELGAGPVEEYRVAGARDTVLVARLGDGGIISYRRADGSFLHTVNTPEGFGRKLKGLGITLGAT